MKADCNGKKIWLYVLWLLAVGAAVVVGSLLFGERRAIWLSLCVAVLACLPFAVSYERQKQGAGSVALLAVMVALSVMGRYAFSFLPHFKPVTAIVVLTGIYLGAGSGFLCGALSALLSNFLMGQGPWTPFQMFAWGILGFAAGLLAKPLHRTAVLCAYGALAGVAFSLLMDVYTTLWFEGGGFSLARYAALCVSALPVTAVYAASNVAFLLILGKPIGEALHRVTEKYGILRK